MQFSIIALLLPLVSHPQIPTESSCGDCHIANPEAPGASHLQDWEYSAHGRNNVGCEGCHGGDATSFEPFLAHRGILGSANPASPVNRRNIPQTCGGCHIGPFVAFQESAHYQMLLEGERTAPNCSSCHGEVAAYLLPPPGLAKECEACHGDPEGSSYHPEYPAQARLFLDLVRETREILEQATRLIQLVEDPDRRARFEEVYQQAEVPLIEAVNTGHSFDFARMEERLTDALARAEALVKDLANP